MSKIEYSILIATVCVSILTGCGKTNEKPDSVSNDANNISDTNESNDFVEASEDESDDLSESDKTEMLSCVRVAEALSFDEFDSVSELGLGHALYYACLKEYENNSGDNLFSKYEVDVSESNDAKLSDEIVKEMLQKHFGNSDVKSYKIDSDAITEKSYEVTGEEVSALGFRTLSDVTVRDFVKSSEYFNFAIGKTNVELDEASFVDGVYKLLVNRTKGDESSSKLEYGFSKNDDGSYCLKYRKIVK